MGSDASTERRGAVDEPMAEAAHHVTPTTCTRVPLHMHCCRTQHVFTRHTNPVDEGTGSDPTRTTTLRTHHWKDFFLDTVWQHGKASASSYLKPLCSHSPLSRTNSSAVFLLFFFFSSITIPFFLCHSYANHSIYHGYVARPGGAPPLDYSFLAAVFLEPPSHL